MNIILNNGVEMPALGYGTYAMRQNEVLKALEVGYRHLDTAEGYGNEEEVAAAIATSGISRKDIFITTKVGNGAQRSDKVLETFEASLKRLNTDYVDMYLIHWPVKESYIKTWQVFEEIYKSGKARAIGLSNFHEHHINDLKAIWSIVPATNQIELHPRLTQKPLVSFCHDLGISITAYSPLGLFRIDAESYETIEKLSEKYGKTSAQIVLRWAIDQNIITIPRTKTLDRVKENFNVFDFKLEQEDIKLIDLLNTNTRTNADPDNFNF